MLTRVAVALFALLPLAAHADDRTSVRVVVRGSLDADALGKALATELRASIELVTADACAAPCLEVDVAAGTASVQFSPVDGEPRSRIVTLGSDRGQWPLVITLLAGNLVRDEAADVLAGLPMPPPRSVADAPPPSDPIPAPPAPPARPPIAGDAPPRDATTAEVEATLVVEPRAPHHLVGVGLVPGLSTDWTHVGRVQHVLSLDLIAGVSGGSSLLTLSGVADIERGPVWGAQLAGVAAVARRVAGVQVAGVAAVTEQLDGVQLAGTAAVADRANGLQIAGVASVARAEGSVAQVAGVAAVARRDARVQVAGVTSVAGDANIQLAGVVNVARELRGLQIAPINVARRVSGVQLGVINVGGDAGGSSFGLINIVPGGRTDLEAAVDSGSTGTLLVRHGGHGWHNVYGIGGHPVDETGPSDDVWMYGLGFGPSWRVAHTRIDLEAIGWQVNHGARHSTDVSILGQLRLSVAHGVGPFAIVAGGALNTYISNDHASPLLVERREEPAMETNDVTVEIWPSAFVGVRL